ncbi:MAG: hypothetical protein V3T05_02400 [Myxococcota bacterium]
MAEARNRHLVKAKKAYQAMQYNRVLPALKRALKIAKGKEEKSEIYELMGLIHATYDRDEHARSAFVKLLEINPGFELPPDSSPKIRDAFVAAREEADAARSPNDDNGGGDDEPIADDDMAADATVGSTGETERTESTEVNLVDLPGPVAPIDPLMPGLISRRRSKAFYKQWWFWTIVGAAVAAGGGYAAYELSQTEPPSYNLGPMPLK